MRIGSKFHRRLWSPKIQTEDEMKSNGLIGFSMTVKMDLTAQDNIFSFTLDVTES